MEALAKMMGVSVADLQGYIDCLRVWMDKGYTMEEAIQKHQEQMIRLANNAVKMAGSLKNSPAFIGGLHSDLRATAA